MNTFLKMVNTQAILFIYLAVGYYCRKKQIFTDETRSKLTDFVVLITLPCMVFSSFRMDFSMDSLIQGGTALLIASVMACFALLAGKFLFNNFDQREKCIMQYGTLVSNSFPLSAVPSAPRDCFSLPCLSFPPGFSCGAQASPCLQAAEPVGSEPKRF